MCSHTNSELDMVKYVCAVTGLQEMWPLKSSRSTILGTCSLSLLAWNYYLCSASVFHKVELLRQDGYSFLNLLRCTIRLACSF